MADQNKPKAPPKRAPLRAGFVFAVPSGDSVVIIDPEASVGTKPPKEINLTLSGLKAPLLGKKFVKEGKAVVEKDEPWAWASREFLRKLVVGKSVVFRVDNEAGTRSYGDLWVGELNVRIELVRLGWSDIVEKPPREGREPREEDVYLKELRDAAKAKKAGIFREAGKGAVRAVKYHESVRGRSDAPLFDFFEKNKNKPLKGVVEQVRSGSTLRVLLTGAFDNILLLLSGIRAPTYSFANDALSEPYSRQAKFITEFYLLNRDVTVVIEGIDKFSNFFGTVVDEQKRNIALNLLETGLAQLVDWSATAGVDVKAYQQAEEKAQKAKLGLWKLQTAPKPSKPTNAPGSADGFMAKVIEIVNAGTIVVRRELKGHGPEDVRLSFSSVSVPRLLPRSVDEKEIEKEAKMNESQREKREEERRGSYYAWMGKELLRQRLVGKVVKCTLDYVRPAFTPKGSDKVIPAKEFHGVYLKDKNVALDLVAAGYANVVPHGTDEPRSPDFQKLIIAEKQAEKAAVGLHSNARVPVVHVNDLTQQDRAKSQSFVPTLKRAGRINASVDYVFSGSRLKLYVPSEELLICFALQGIVSEKVQKAPSKKGADDLSEMYPPSLSIGNQALHLTRENLLQHDVEIEVDACDKGGNFIGALYIKKEFFGVDLVRQGLAKVNHRSAENLKAYKALAEAEAEAKDRRRGVWVDFDPEEEKRKAAEAIAAREKAYAAKADASKVTIVVTDIVDGGNFWYQEVGDATAALESLMATFQAQDFNSQPAYTPKKGEIVAGQFSVDDNWYRAEVTRIINGKEGSETLYQLLYVDYGNVEVVPASRIRALGADFSLAILPRQATHGRLAFVRAPRIDQDHGVDAAATLKELVWDKKLVATVQYKDGDATYVTLSDTEGTKTPINASLVAQGLARVQKSRTQSAFYETLLEEQKKARERRLNIWQYGDLDSDEDQ